MDQADESTNHTMGSKAPPFSTIVSKRHINFPDEFKGRWVILLSCQHDLPAAIIGEYGTVDSLIKKFSLLNTRLIGLSADLALDDETQQWHYKDTEPYEDLTFPVCKDIGAAQRYGILCKDRSPYGMVNIIDPKGIIRMIISYPDYIQHNFHEILRILVALQQKDLTNGSSPPPWHPILIVSPTGSGNQARRLCRDGA